MEILVSKKDNDLVEVKHELFDEAFLISLGDFFDFVLGSINKSFDVADLSFEDNRLTFTKCDFLEDSFFTDTCVFDEALMSDKDFVESINEILDYYKQVKDILNETVDKSLEIMREMLAITNQAKSILREYCLKGCITLPDEKDSLKRVYEALANCHMNIFTCYSEDKKDDRVYNVVELDELPDASCYEGMDIQDILRIKSREAAVLLKKMVPSIDDDGAKVYTKKENSSLPVVE